MICRMLAVLSCGLTFIGSTCLAQQVGDVSPATSSPATSSPQPTPAVSSSGWQRDDRLTLSGDGATLTGTNGGGGGSAGYLHQLSPDALVGLGAEYQSLYTANWAFGSLSAAFSHALTASTRWNVHAEIHEGEGHTAGQRFDYGIEALGVGSSIPGGFALDLEERQIDVATSHGSLPKATLSKNWGTHWLTTVAYAHSYGGNLNTNYTLARVDFYSSFVNLLAGGSIGHVNPVVVNIDGLLGPTETLHLDEDFAGLSKSFGRCDVMLLADAIDLQGSHHFIGTLAVTVHLH
jgi:hypothetical protein